MFKTYSFTALHLPNFISDTLHDFFNFTEDQYIIAKRRKYLRLIRQYRREGRPIYWMDETYCESKSTVWKLRKITLTFFHKKIHETNVFTKEDTKELIEQNFCTL